MSKAKLSYWLDVNELNKTKESFNLQFQDQIFSGQIIKYLLFKEFKKIFACLLNVLGKILKQTERGQRNFISYLWVPIKFDKKTLGRKRQRRSKIMMTTRNKIRIRESREKVSLSIFRSEDEARNVNQISLNLGKKYRILQLIEFLFRWLRFPELVEKYFLVSISKRKY